MISCNVRSANRYADRALLAQSVACFVMIGSLACLTQPASAQAQAAEPYYADGDIHCPDGSSATYHSAGEPPNELALRLACEFKGTVEPTTKSQTAEERTAADKAAFEMLEAMNSMPRSPNGLPMEASWERAPGAPDAEFTDARPYFVSRWGGIVIRGRRNGNQIDKALSARHCGASDNPATDIYFIGEAPANICEGVTEVPPNQVQSLKAPITIKGLAGEYTKVGTSSGWAVLAFAQNIADVMHPGKPPATDENEMDWGVTSLGAFYRNEGGQHVFYAPGETVQLTKVYSFVVEPVMLEQALVAQGALAEMNRIAADQAMTERGQAKAEPPSKSSALLDLGVPLVLLGGAIYCLAGFLRRRRQVRPPVQVVSRAGSGSIAAADDAAPVLPGPMEAGSGIEAVTRK
ncbi:MAG: hypothetical protein IPG62_14265 [Sphingomonadales bacterium]|nr:hypothetical protein [Sphingomonadales bacterium]